MLTVAEALELVRQHARPLPPRRLRLGELLGLRLAEDVTSASTRRRSTSRSSTALPSPRAIARPRCASSSWSPRASVPTRAVEPGTTIRVMTGAPMPAGADAVVKWEDCEQLDDATIRNPAAQAVAGVVRAQARGLVSRRADGARPRQAARGRSTSRCSPRSARRKSPRTRGRASACCRRATSWSRPTSRLGPGQIRNSNGPMLLAALAAAGATASISASRATIRRTCARRSPAAWSATCCWSPAACRRG